MFRGGKPLFLDNQYSHGSPSLSCSLWYTTHYELKFVKQSLLM